MYTPNSKSVALPVPGIIGGILQNWTVPGYAHAPFSPKFLMGFYSDGPCKSTPKFEVRTALPAPEIRGVAKLQTPNLGEGEAIGGRDWYRSKERR